MSEERVTVELTDEERARQHFRDATVKHEMEVLYDDGLYRHLRFQSPGTLMYGYDLVTWPGYLAINGDLVSGYTFSRLLDMIQFFASDAEGINPTYWSEKITNHAARAATRVYDDEADPYDDERAWHWDHCFLLCCWAIRSGVDQYRAALDQDGAER